MKSTHRTARNGGWLTVCALTAALFQGCGGSTLPPPSEPEQARPILTTALDAWKKGEKPASLTSASPPVQVIDHQWDSGWSLLGYEFQGEPLRHGVNIQQAVAMELKNPKGKVVKKTSNFLVTTGNNPVVTREDLDGE